MGGQISSSGKNITGNLNTIPHLVTGLLPLHARNGFEIDISQPLMTKLHVNLRQTVQKITKTHPGHVVSSLYRKNTVSLV